MTSRLRCGGAALRAAEALESLDQAQGAGREAMREMRQTVRLLLPHVRDLPDLVDEYVSAGLNVKLDADRDLGAVSGDVGLAAYRTAPESLANVAKHAPGSASRVQVRVSATELRLTVNNEIVSAAAPGAAAPGLGHGVAGMTQRAALVGARSQLVLVGLPPRRRQTGRAAA